MAGQDLVVVGFIGSVEPRASLPTVQEFAQRVAMAVAVCGKAIDGLVGDDFVCEVPMAARGDVFCVGRDQLVRIKPTHVGCEAGTGRGVHGGVVGNHEDAQGQSGCDDWLCSSGDRRCRIGCNDRVPADQPLPHPADYPLHIVDHGRVLVSGGPRGRPIRRTPTMDASQWIDGPFILGIRWEGCHG